MNDVFNTPIAQRSRALTTGQFWCISDTHWLHRNMLKYEPIRTTLPYDVDRYMVDQWQQYVKPEDTILHLGDLALGDPDDFANISRGLTGHRFMLDTGNHDLDKKRKRTRQWYADHGFVMLPEFSIDFQGWTIEFTHRPQYPLTTDKTINAHGHVHSKSKNNARMINFSVEVIDFRPVWLPDVLQQRIDSL